MKILITGANGFFAQHLCLFLVDKGFQVIAVSRGDCKIPITEQISYFNLELTDVSLVNDFVYYHQPEVIIHAAAMSKPDECNNNKDECILQNVTVTEQLVKLANDIQAHFIYISTDFIFGENGPHAEENEPDPLNFYGESKLRAEKFVKNTLTNYTIVRPVFIYGATWNGIRPSFIQWIQSNLEAGKAIKVVSDQQRTPTFVIDICWGIHQIIVLKKYGVYHLAGKDICSPYDMALAVAKVLKLNSNLIIEVTSDTFPEPVRRAKKSGLKIDKAITELNYQPHSFEEGVRKSFGR
jgi:dTDP-4-dehydrorhamnose reductase